MTGLLLVSIVLVAGAALTVSAAVALILGAVIRERNLQIPQDDEDHSQP